MNKIKDWLIFGPDDVDLSKSPLRAGIQQETYVLGAFNPGMCRLPNGNVLLMVRVAEALSDPVKDDAVHSIRWTRGRYVADAYPLEDVDMDDPRKFTIKSYTSNTVFALTSLSWLLPVELSPDGMVVMKVHYDMAIAPDRTSQEYGIEDARISKLGDNYWMTCCTVSSERHATTLFSSSDGINYHFEGIILDHQNKDMLIFEGMPGGKYYALTRPLGALYFRTPPDSEHMPGPSINLASSPDLLHWKPLDLPFIRPEKGSGFTNRIGGGSPPVLTKRGWLMFYHGVEEKGKVGVYKTYWAMLDKDDPLKIIRNENRLALLESKEGLTEEIKDKRYINDVIFTTGILDADDHFLLASGELDLACRMSAVPKTIFEL